MKLQIMILAVSLVTIIGPAAGIVYSACELARVLPQCGLNFSVNDWVCLANTASGGDTGLISGPNFDDSYNFGLFQINTRWWCGLNGPGGDCNISCWDLLDSNIVDDCACARKIYDRHGFSAWFNWVYLCQPAPNVSPC